jgi:hypothetical protein
VLLGPAPVVRLVGALAHSGAPGGSRGRPQGSVLADAEVDENHAALEPPSTRDGRTTAPLCSGLCRAGRVVLVSSRRATPRPTGQRYTGLSRRTATGCAVFGWPPPR